MTWTLYWGVATALSEVAPVVSPATVLVAQSDQPMRDCVGRREVRDAHHHVNDRFGGQPGHGGAADVLYGDRGLGEPSLEPSGLGQELLWPRLVVGREGDGLIDSAHCAQP